MAFAQNFAGEIDELQGQRLALQAVISIKGSVYMNEGDLRRKKIDDIGVASDRIIGDPKLEKADRRLDIFEGDPLMQVVDENEFTADQGHLFDSRGTFFSSFAGYTIPPHIKSESQWQDHTRFVGNAAFDVLLSQPSGQIQYGITAWGSGSIGGALHRAPEAFFTGDYLWLQKPPFNAAEREKWAKSLFYDTEHCLVGAYKPVLRKWNPFGAIDYLRDALSQHFSSADMLQYRFEQLDPTFNNTAFGEPTILSDETVTALNLARSDVVRAFFGAMVLEEFGLVKFVAVNPASRDAWRQRNDEVMQRGGVRALEQRVVEPTAGGAAFQARDLNAAEKAARKNARLFVATELGLLKREMREQPYHKLQARVVGVCSHSLFNDDRIRDLNDASTFFPDEPLISAQDTDLSVLRRAQTDATNGAIAAIVDRYHRHAANIAAKSIRNSKPGVPTDISIMN